MMLPRDSDQQQAKTFIVFAITSPDGSVREKRLELRPELEDVPLEVALGLVPGDRVQLVPPPEEA